MDARPTREAVAGVVEKVVEHVSIIVKAVELAAVIVTVVLKAGLKVITQYCKESYAVSMEAIETVETGKDASY